MNYFKLAASATGNAVSLTSAGSDTDVGITVTPKGVGALTLTSGATTASGWVVTGNSLSSGIVSDISSTSTAGTASGVSYVQKLTRSGANANTAHTAYGLYSTVTNTNATSGTNVAGYFSASGATTANYGLIVAAGNVGIDSATPTAALDVTGAAKISSTLAVTGNITLSGTGNSVGTITSGTWNGTAISLTSYASGTLQAAQEPAHTGDVTNSAGSLALSIASGHVTNAMLAGSIAASKLVGTDIATVGTITSGTWNAGAVTASGEILQSGSLGEAMKIDSSASGSWMKFANSGTARGFIGYVSGSASLFSSGEIANAMAIRSEGAFQLGTNGGTVRMTVDTSGKVGIGTTSMSGVLQVAGGTTGSYFATTDYAGGSAGSAVVISTGTATGNTFGAIQSYNAGGTGFANTVINNGGGNVGIGTTIVSYTLHVNGSVAGTSAYNNLSDARFKKNVATVSGALEKISKIRGISYEWNEKGHSQFKFSDRRELGVLAQEVEKVFPEAVSADKRGFKSVAYSMLTAPLIEAVKELNAKLDKLTATVIAGLKDFGIWIEKGATRIASLVAKHLTVGSAEHPSGITVYDDATDEPYCVRMHAGAWISSKGSCDAAPQADNDNQQSKVRPAAIGY